MLPGEGELPQLALTSKLYEAAPAPPGEMVDGVVCETVADIVRRRFWVISPLQNYKSAVPSDCTNQCCLV